MPASKRKRVATPVPVRDRCSMIDRKGRGCVRRAGYIVTRIDGSSFQLCIFCTKRLRDQREERGEYFERLRFSAINKNAGE